MKRHFYKEGVKFIALLYRERKKHKKG